MSKKPKQTKCHPFSFCQDHWLTCNLVTRSLKHANVPSDPCALSKFSGLIAVSPFSQTERQPRVSLPVAPLVAWPCSSLTRSLWTGLRHHPSFRPRPRLRLTCSLLRISLVAAGSELVSTRPQRLLFLWHPIPNITSLLPGVLKPGPFRKCAKTRPRNSRASTCRTRFLEGLSTRIVQTPHGGV